MRKVLRLVDPGHADGPAGLETGPPECRLPGGHVQQRAMLEAPVGVGAMPPAVEQAEGDGSEVVGRRQLVEHQKTAGAQQLGHMGERPVDLARGVENVDRDDDVRAAGGKALGGGLLLDVEHLEVPVRAGKARLAMTDEARRDIGIAILDRKSGGLDAGEHLAGGRARAGADLDDDGPLAARLLEVLERRDDG